MPVPTKIGYSAMGGPAGGQVTAYARLRFEDACRESLGFDYNPARQIRTLTQSSTQYNYTEAQNRVGSCGVKGLNQYTSINGVTVANDSNGNVTADGAGMTFSYDMESRLFSTGTPASGCA